MLNFFITSFFVVQRLQKLQPNGGFEEEGTSPSNRIFCFDRSFIGSSIGIEDNKAFVYACIGLL